MAKQVGKLDKALLYLFPFWLLFLSLPTLVYRYALFLATKRGWVGGQDLGKMLCASSTSHAVMNCHGSGVISIILDGILSLNQVQNHVESVTLQQTRTDGTLKFPELRQTIASFGGFLFWRNVENLNIKDRIKELPAIQRLEESHRLLTDLTSKPWTFGSEPLWEIILVRVTQENKTLFLLRLHHALCDGFSTVSLVNSFATAKLVLPSGNGSSSMSWKQGIIKLLRIPVDIAHFGIASYKGLEPLKDLIRHTGVTGMLTNTSSTFPLPFLKMWGLRLVLALQPLHLQSLWNLYVI